MKRLRNIIVWSALAASVVGCIKLPKPPDIVPKPPSPTQPENPTTAARAIGASVSDTTSHQSVVGATALLKNRETGAAYRCGTDPCVTDAAGYAGWPDVPIGAPLVLELAKDGYLSGKYEFTLNADTSDVSASLTPVEKPKPWETVTWEQLRAWRSSISTVLAPMPCGPRPGQANNVMFTALFDNSCWSADDRERAIAAYTAKNFTHWPIGPIESHGYHGLNPDMSWVNNPDGFADRLEELWRAGKIPVFFALPDTGFCADGRHVDWDCVESRLTPIYTSPRFQALVKIAVDAWEPDYELADSVKAAKWLARVFPNAYRGIHRPSGHSAPCLGSELVEGGGTIPNEGACWAPVLPFIHFYLQQETWTFGGEAAPGRTGKQQFLYNMWDTSHRFAEGSWGPAGAGGKPIDVIAYEYSSYYVTNDPGRAKEADEWGDAAVSGAPFTDPLTGRTIDTARYLTGYGDGGTVDVLARQRARPTFSLMPPSTTAPRHYTFTFNPAR